MRKFYNEPEMAVKRFEAEDIVTASETNNGAGNDNLSNGYATATGTLSRDGANVVLQFN